MLLKKNEIWRVGSTEKVDQTLRVQVRVLVNILEPALFEYCSHIKWSEYRFEIYTRTCTRTGLICLVGSSKVRVYISNLYSNPRSEFLEHSSAWNFFFFNHAH